MIKKFDMPLLFNALADQTRLRLLNLLAGDEICVCFFVEALRLSQPKISRHLAYLRRAGIVAARRDGKWIHYRLAAPSDASAAAVLDSVLQWIARDPEMKKDRELLLRACCSPRAPQLKRAPKPAGLAT